MNTAQDMQAMLTAARVFAAITAEAIAQAGAGITLPQLRVLVLASRPGALNATGVAEALDVHLSTASRICDRLVQGGLLDRRDRPEDRRQVELTLTGDGQNLLLKVTDHRQAVFGRILRRMDSDGRKSLIEGLTEFVNAAKGYDAHRSLVP